MAGSYRKRGNKYYLEYMYKGKRYSKTIECTNKNVKTELNRFVIEVQDNEKIMQAQKFYFKNVAQEFLDNYVRKNLKPRTVDYYIYLLNSRILPYFHNYKISDIKKSDIKNFLLSISNELTEVTLKKYRNCLVTIFNYAIEMEYILYNPASNITVPKGKKIIRKKNFYDINQLKRMLECLENERIEYKMFVYIIAFTGIRREECLPLTFNDIDFQNKFININKAMVFSKEKGLIIDSTKSVHSNRRITIPNVLFNELVNYKKVNNNDKLFHLTPNSITQWFSKFIKRHNLDHITLHGLRHTYATFLISQNNDINIISTLLGHSNVNITAQIYIEKDYTNEKNAVSSFDKIL